MHIFSKFGVPDEQKWPKQNRKFSKSKFPQKCFDFFWIFLGPPGAGNGSKMCPRRPAFEPQSIVQIRPMATRLVAKNCFQNFRNSRNSFSARCISAYSECRQKQSLAILEGGRRSIRLNGGPLETTRFSEGIFCFTRMRTKVFCCCFFAGRPHTGAPKKNALS